MRLQYDRNQDACGESRAGPLPLHTPHLKIYFPGLFFV